MLRASHGSRRDLLVTVGQREGDIDEVKSTVLYLEN